MFYLDRPKQKNNQAFQSQTQCQQSIDMEDLRKKRCADRYDSSESSDR